MPNFLGCGRECAELIENSNVGIFHAENFHNWQYLKNTINRKNVFGRRVFVILLDVPDLQKDEFVRMLQCIAALIRTEILQYTFSTSLEVQFPENILF